MADAASKQENQVPKSKDEVTVEIVELTPDMAREYLESNVDYQRTLSRKRVESMAEAILAGEWYLTGQPIIINDEGEMIDGQHRCAAVIMADTPIDILIVEGVDGRVFPAIDTGKARSAADVLKISGFQNTAMLAAIARCIISYNTMGEMHQNQRSISGIAVLDFVRMNETSLIPLVKWYNNHIKDLRIISIGSALPALQWLCMTHRVPVSITQEFVEKLLFGEGLTKKDPIYQFRDALIYAASHPTHRILLRNKTARLIKTWNAWRKGESHPNATKWNAISEDYPQIVYNPR